MSIKYTDIDLHGFSKVLTLKVFLPQCLWIFVQFIDDISEIFILHVCGCYGIFHEFYFYISISERVHQPLIRITYKAITSLSAFTRLSRLQYTISLPYSTNLKNMLFVHYVMASQMCFKVSKMFGCLQALALYLSFLPMRSFLSILAYSL